MEYLVTVKVLENAIKLPFTLLNASIKRGFVMFENWDENVISTRSAQGYIGVSHAVAQIQSLYERGSGIAIGCHLGPPR